MLLVLPYRTNLIPRRTPYANYILIAANIAVFLMEYHITKDGGWSFRPWVEPFMLDTQRPALWQFISYAFLHAGPWHILGNMFFLYLFGNNVNDKLGNVGYLSFYLAGAVFSGIGHVLLNSATNAPTLGASGAVAAVTGAYLVLFPQTLIDVFLWFFIFVYTIEVSALYFIALKMIIIDNVMLRYASVAYDAHLSGYAFGIISMIGLLATGLISSSQFDLWAMIKRWNRRRTYRDTVAYGYDPFNNSTVRHVESVEVEKTDKQRQEDQKILNLRTEISSRILERNLSAAARIYLELMAQDNQQVLPRQQLLDIANQLTGEKRNAEAAQAYENFLTHYGSYEYASQVQLMLGLLYSRYLNMPDLAIQHLRVAAKDLTDPGQLKMCSDEIARLEHLG
jgi:membrane associated rhomboid family serine protease